MNNIKRLRMRKGLSQKELAIKVGVSQPTASDWETGKKNPTGDNLERLARMFSVSREVILGIIPVPIERSTISAPPKAETAPTAPAIPGFQTIPYSAPTVMLPIIGSVRCGEGGLAFEEDLGAEPATVPNAQEYFWLRAEGDSMEPRICDGDLVLVHQQETVDSGDIAVVVVNDEEGTLKQVFIANGTIALIPYNQSHPTRTFFGKETARVRIVGKAVESKRKY